MTSAIDRRVAEARERIDILDLSGAAAARDAAALFIDIRPVAQRQEFGEIPVRS